MSIRRAVGQWIQRQAVARVTRRRVIHGFPTTIINTRADIDTDDVVARLDGALSLLKQYVPHHYRRLRRDLSGFLVERRAYRGAFIVATRTCLVELTFVVNRSFSLAQVAATILHEAMHARLYARGIAVTVDQRHPQERFCRRAEIEFGSVVPEGEPVVRRAVESLALSDKDIAPEVDPGLAGKRVAEADLAASTLPLWLKRHLARQQEIDWRGGGPGAA